MFESDETRRDQIKMPECSLIVAECNIGIASALAVAAY